MPVRGAMHGSPVTSAWASRTLVADDFERASLGSSWTVRFPVPDNGGPGGAAQNGILGSSDLGTTNGANSFSIVERTGETFAANQFAEGRISTDAVTAVWSFQAFVRRDNGTGARYGFHYDNDPTQGPYGRWCIKYDGVASNLTRVIAQSAVDFVNVPQPGDTLRIEVVGYTINAYWNGALLLSATDTDSTKIASGRPGLASRIANFGDGTNPTTSKNWESFAAGDL